MFQIDTKKARLEIAKEIKRYRFLKSRSESVFNKNKNKKNKNKKNGHDYKFPLLMDWELGVPRLEILENSGQLLFSVRQLWYTATQRPRV